MVTICSSGFYGVAMEFQQRGTIMCHVFIYTNDPISTLLLTLSQGSDYVTVDQSEVLRYLRRYRRLEESRMS